MNRLFILTLTVLLLRILPAIAEEETAAPTQQSIGQPQTGQLMNEIQKLQERIGELEEKQARPAPEAGKIPEAEEALSGYDRGFFIGSGDRNYLLKMNFAIQFRYTYTAFDDKLAANYEDWSNFLMRRARLWFQGNAPGKDWAYYLHMQIEPAGKVNLQDAYITWKKYRAVQVQAGRSKMPYGLEFWNSATRLNGIERTIFSGETGIDGKTDLRKWPGGNANFQVSNEDSTTKFPTGGLNLYRSQGFQLQGDIGSSGLLQYWAGVYNGRNTKDAPAADTNPLIVGRAAVNPMGKCNLSQQGDLEGTRSPKVCLVVSGMQYTDRLTKYRDSNGTTKDDTYDINVTGYNIAGVFRFRGVSLDPELGTERFEQDRTGGHTWERWGCRASAGYFVLPGRLEVVARYARVERLKNNTEEDSLASGLGLVSFDGKTNNAIEKSLREVSGGLNYYIDGHRLKVFADYSLLSRSLEAVPGAAPVDDQTDHRFRTMIQMYY